MKELSSHTITNDPSISSNDEDTPQLIQTKGNGPTFITARQRIDFVRSPFGFEGLTQWALFDSKYPLFFWLQSLDNVQIAFIIINPYLICQHYLLDIPEQDYELIGKPEDPDILTFAIVTVPENSLPITANLLGPIVINRKELIGVQAISLDTRWTTKHPINPPQNTEC